MSGKIQTVLGPADPGKFGVTLTHEHLSLTSQALALPPKNDTEKTNSALPITMENLWWIRQNPYTHRNNLEQYEDPDAVTNEMKFYKKNGGCSVVEVTTVGIRPEGYFRCLKQLAQTTGVNIVAGTGYYLATSRPSTHSLTAEEMENFMTTEIIHGDEETSIKCGVIGEIGCSYPLIDTERKAVQAAAAVQSKLGVPVIIHPGRHKNSPPEIIRIFQEAGGSAGRLVMSHLDRTIDNNGDLLDLAALGSYCEWDLFGIEESHYQQNLGFDMPSDAQRIQYIRTLIEEGYADKVVIAHDIHTKHRMMKYGGHGYSHIQLNIVPKMALRGITPETVNKILVENPRAWLTTTK